MTCRVAAGYRAGRTLRDMAQLILLRHGQSTWNLENLFTGWTDVPLTEQGMAEAATAGRLLREADILPEVAHTSLLRRAGR